MNNQLIKDFGRLLNDTRIGFCDVRSDNMGAAAHLYDETYTGDGIIIGCVSFAYGDGNYTTLDRDVHVTYGNITDMVRALYSAHPTRNMDDVLYSIKYDTRRQRDTLAVTQGSNYELYGERHAVMSLQLTRCLAREAKHGESTVFDLYTDRYISDSDRSGGYKFKL